MSDLPFGKQFTARQIDLEKLLEITAENEGEKEDLENSIEKEFHAHKSSSSTHAYNTRLATQHYGLIDEDFNLTDFGKELYRKYQNGKDIYQDFARHILLDLNDQFLSGLRVLEIIDEMKSREEEVTLENLTRRFQDLGYEVAKGGEDFSAIRSWLEKAGIITSRSWDINLDKFQEILSVGIEEIHILDKLPPDQSAFLRALSLPEFEGEIIASEVAEIAEKSYGVEMSMKDLPKKTLGPLQERGYIDMKKATSGRGAKSYRIKKTDKFEEEIYRPILEILDETTGLSDIEILQMPLSKLFEKLEAPERDIKGKALEGIGLRITQLLGLRPLWWREKGPKTGGIEIDGLAEQRYPCFGIWQIQCKNTKTSVRHLKEEVGAAQVSPYPSVILFITTFEFSSNFRQYSHQVMKERPVTIILMNGEDVHKLEENVTNIFDILNRETNEARKAKLGYLPEFIKSRLSRED